MAPCYINMFVCGAYGIYYLYIKKYFLSFAAVALAFMTTSNFANVILILALVVAFFAINVKKARAVILSQIGFFALFYLFISFGNLQYFRTSVKSKSVDKTESRVFKTLGKKTGSNHKRGNNTGKVESGKDVESLNNKQFGKLIALNQTKDFLFSSPQNFLFGAGMGEFSSQLALRTSDINAESKSRVFRFLPQYISSDFYNNHYQVFAVVYELGDEYHSIRHLPNSEVNHILGEYGFAGLVLFFVLYVWFFLKRARQLSYSILIGIMAGYFLLFDYMFEYLSLVLFFEIFFLIDLKRKEEENTAT